MQVMVGVAQDLLRHERRRADALDAGHGAGALLRPVHARGVELHDAVGVRQPAVADARVLGIELAQVDAGDQRVEDVLAFGDHAEGHLDAGLACRRSCSVWPLADDTTTGLTLLRITAGACADVRVCGGRGQTRARTGDDEFAAVDFRGMK